MEHAQAEMNGFGWALIHLKNGKKVARSGWNGKGMWLVLISSWDWDLNPSIKIFDSEFKKNNGIITDPWIGMKTADDKFVPWICSQTDMLAEDWSLTNY